MVIHIRELMNKVTEEEEQKRLVEIAFLEAQINPHFISNVLNNVIWMAKIPHADNIIPLVQSLNSMLQNVMHQEHDLILLKHELTKEGLLDVLNQVKIKYKIVPKESASCRRTGYCIYDKKKFTGMEIQKLADEGEIAFECTNIVPIAVSPDYRLSENVSWRQSDPFLCCKQQTGTYR